VRDVFAAVVSHADGGPARPWWEFTPERKARDAVRKLERSVGEGGLTPFVRQPLPGEVRI
jgi:hypothetical protein